MVLTNAKRKNRNNVGGVETKALTKSFVINVIRQKGGGEANALD